LVRFGAVLLRWIADARSGCFSGTGPYRAKEALPATEGDEVRLMSNKYLLAAVLAAAALAMYASVFVKFANP
jgi:hypothetical protein